jgi:hypothetical protein
MATPNMTPASRPVAVEGDVSKEDGEEMLVAGACNQPKKRCN